MNKKSKKLVLAKETVRNLEKRELGRVAGGATVYCPSGIATCGTCACGPTQTGTSRYC